MGDRSGDSQVTSLIQIMESDLYGIMYHKMWEREPISTSSSMLRDAVNILNKQAIA